MAILDFTLAPAGSTGNNSHTAIQISDRGLYVVQFTVEAVGSTPTVTWALQGAFDNVKFNTFSTISSNTTNTTTAVVSVTQTSVGNATQFLIPGAFARWFQLVTTSNTNVTYSAKLYTVG